MQLAHRVIAVTGASSGIGRATAIALAREGARVAAVARRADRLAEVVHTIDAFGGQARAFPADVREEQAVIATMDAICDHFGGLHGLVNAAGIGRQGSLIEGRTEDWREEWEVNVLGLCIATREALRRFPSDGGHVVHISSLSGHRVPPGAAFYAATKFAVRALAESLRHDLRARGNRTRVTCISPGTVDTEFFEGYFHGDRQRAERHRRRYRPLDPQDVARAVVFAMTAPPHVDVNDVLLRSVEQQV